MEGVDSLENILNYIPTLNKDISAMIAKLPSPFSLIEKEIFPPHTHTHKKPHREIFDNILIKEGLMYFSYSQIVGMNVLAFAGQLFLQQSTAFLASQPVLRVDEINFSCGAFSDQKYGQSMGLQQLHNLKNVFNLFAPMKQIRKCH